MDAETLQFVTINNEQMVEQEDEEQMLVSVVVVGVEIARHVVAVAQWTCKVN
jgi:hypothetical protein